MEEVAVVAEAAEAAEEEAAEEEVAAEAEIPPLQEDLPQEIPEGETTDFSDSPRTYSPEITRR